MKEQITMAEKFRKNVAVPEELAKKLRKFIEKKKVVKTVKERRQKFSTQIYVYGDNYGDNSPFSEN